MANLELLSEEEFRIDGRKTNEIRRINCRLGVFEQSDGSAYIEMGNTRVLAAVYGPHDIRGSRNKNQEEKAIINCQYSMATFSTSERKKRSRGDYRSTEITNNLKQVFDSAILTELYPHSQIDIYLEVIQSDGSNFSACVNAASLAIIHAGIPIKDIVCACSAGLINGKPIADVNFIEESMGTTPILTIGMLPKDKQILSIESSGKIHLNNLNSVMETAINGCLDVLYVMKSAILNHIAELKD